MKRGTLALVVLAAVVVSSLTTWYASSQIRSPAEVAARTAPPEPSPILVKVEQRVLATKIVSRGTAQYGSPREVTVPPSALKGAGRIVTGLPGEGALVREGNVLLTISGRPVFVLDGSQPSYRDLGPGMVGKDVLQLERALARLGFRPGAVNGVYDAATGRAVTALYRSRGFEPVTATDARLAEVRPIEADLVAGARARGGVQLPADEVVFMPATPLRVAKLNAALGTPPKGALVTVTNSVVAIAGTLPVEQAGLIRRGAPVRIDEPALGIKAAGTVASVAERPGTDGADAFRVAFEVAVPKPPPALVGTSVRLTVPIRSTRTATLAVPASAVSLAPDGESRVQRAVAGKLSFVPVDPGLSADGYVAVKPRGQLAKGDLVVVGFDANRETRGR